MIKFVGLKKIESFKDIEGEMVEITYIDDKVERFSKVMFDEIASKKPCDLSTLRDKRVRPVVSELLGVIRRWGIKINELPYLSSLMNTSLDENHKAALCKLWGEYMPEPLTPDEVDYVTVDRVLKPPKDE